MEGSIRFRAPEVPIDGAGRGAVLEGAKRPKAPPRPAPSIGTEGALNLIEHDYVGR